MLGNINVSFTSTRTNFNKISLNIDDIIRHPTIYMVGTIFCKI